LFETVGRLRLVTEAARVVLKLTPKHPHGLRRIYDEHRPGAPVGVACSQPDHDPLTGLGRQDDGLADVTSQVQRHARRIDRAAAQLRCIA
jgi:hypothetical protein